MKYLADLLKLGGKAAPTRRVRLRLSASHNTPIYAIGDIHGCLEQLLDLEERIVADAQSLRGEKLIIMLGDYVDRGPDSAQVLEHLSAPPPAGFKRICLAGNHEILMLAYLEGRCALSKWMALGAGATLLSYGINHDRLQRVYGQADEMDAVIRSAIPAAHAAFLRSLPLLVQSPGFVFVHAGFHPNTPPEQQPDEVLVSIRSAFYERAHLLRQTVIHGHTPVTKARLEGRRLNIDTGACFGGPLTAVRIWGRTGRFIQSPSPTHSTRSP